MQVQISQRPWADYNLYDAQRDTSEYVEYLMLSWCAAPNYRPRYHLMAPGALGSGRNTSGGAAPAVGRLPIAPEHFVCYVDSHAYPSAGDLVERHIPQPAAHADPGPLHGKCPAIPAGSAAVPSLGLQSAQNQPGCSGRRPVGDPQIGRAS